MQWTMNGLTKCIFAVSLFAVLVGLTLLSTGSWLMASPGPARETELSAATLVLTGLTMILGGIAAAYACWQNRSRRGNQ